MNTACPTTKCLAERERENYSNSKTLILKDSSVRSIWTYLTGSPCYTTNTNNYDYTTNKYYKQFIDAVSQSSSEINEFLFMDIQIRTINILGKHVIQTNPSKFDERLFSDIYLCRLRLKQGRDIQDCMFEAGSSRGTLQRRIC